MCTASAIVPLGGSCSELTSAGLVASWTGPSGATAAFADIYDLEFSTTAGVGGGEFPRFWSQTSHECTAVEGRAGAAPPPRCSTTLVDLLPATTYQLRVRAHSAANFSLAIGWSNFSAAWRCTTATTPVHTPGIPVRRGNLSADAISLRWAAPSAASLASRVVSSYIVESWSAAKQSWSTLATVSVPATAATLSGLSPATAFRLRVVARSASGDVPGEPSVLRTADPAVRMVTAWRVTDFLANERTIDFLGDHDAYVLQLQS
jgi:hypothetical protein